MGPCQQNSGFNLRPEVAFPTIELRQMENRGSNLAGNIKMKVSLLSEDDRAWVKERTELLFGGEFVVSRHEVHDPHKLPGFIVTLGPERLGVATYHITGGVCELVTIDSLSQFSGVGTMLLEKVEQTAIELGCTKLWTIAPNDNLDAHRFFQRRGFFLTNVRIGGMTKIRLLKPSVPRVGYYGIPVRDEFEFEKTLEASAE